MMGDDGWEYSSRLALAGAQWPNTHAPLRQAGLRTIQR